MRIDKLFLLSILILVSFNAKADSFSCEAELERAFEGYFEPDQRSSETSHSVTCTDEENCKDKKPILTLIESNDERYPETFEQKPKTKQRGRKKGKKYESDGTLTQMQAQAAAKIINRKKDRGSSEDTTLCEHALDGFCQLGKKCSDKDYVGNTCVIDGEDVEFDGVEVILVKNGFEIECKITTSGDYCKCSKL